ncbi:hypothetical protein MA16_Dca012487 [Dendrobium catenatum]|uniref:Uncharacterized protein n=1 Tax=Dendrobium catenatum TaxID=906689 RepID=A0A2I0XD39_9ASPA|nr:hypothetical protein MA16_Dca012487 [Dendrobium catenatum]
MNSTKLKTLLQCSWRTGKPPQARLWCAWWDGTSVRHLRRSEVTHKYPRAGGN